MRIDNINEQNKYIRARKRVEEIKSFYSNLVAYFVVIPFLIFVNYNTYWEYQWFWWPMLGWGIGNVIQAFKIYGYGESWEDRKIKEIMNKTENNNNY